jgi:helicase
MTQATRSLETRRGTIRFPSFIPVTTFGATYPLDDLVRPYMPRLAPAMLASYYYARQMETAQRLPLFIDSGGFVSLFAEARVCTEGELGIIEIARDDGQERIRPQDVLELQERIGDVAFSLDFPIPPGMARAEAERRQTLTIANAMWALRNRRRRDLPLYACVQGWDVASARACARAYAAIPFEGIAIGGLVPRAHDLELVLGIVSAVRAEIGNRPLHVLGLGKPEMLSALFAAGVDSADSSAYVQLAADGQLWNRPSWRMLNPSPTDRLHLALCNLAAASGRALPLSASGLVFTTHALVAAAGTEG